MCFLLCVCGGVSLLQLTASLLAMEPHSQCDVCVNRFTALRPAQLPSPLFITTIKGPQPSTHFRSCSRIAGRSERSASGRKEPIPGQKRGDIPTPSAVRASVLYHRREASEITVCSLCVCVCRCVFLCKRQQWVAEADWPAVRHEGQTRRNTTKTTSACCFKIKASARQMQRILVKSRQVKMICVIYS